MKSILILCVLSLSLIAGWAYLRYAKNPPSLFPLSYTMAKEESFHEQATVMIIGDRMGHYWGQFHAHMNEVISANLEKPIKISSLAMEKNPLHRTISQLKNLQQWPGILIYQGGSEEWSEEIFYDSQIPIIKKNFEYYHHPNIRSALMLYPPLARVIYSPIKRISLNGKGEFSKTKKIENINWLELHYQLYKEHLYELVSMAYDKNTLLILTTSPINLFIKPNKVCEFSSDNSAYQSVQVIEKKIKSKDFKGAYQLGKNAIANYPSHADLLYYTGLSAYKMGLSREGIELLKSATAYDCELWRSNVIYNNIIREVARKENIILFDFAVMIEKKLESESSVEIFMDKIYPEQKLYQEASQELGKLIKRILKI